MDNRATQTGGEFSAANSKVLIGCFIAMACTAATVIFTPFGIYLKPIAEEMNWSRTQVSFGIALASVTGALITPLTGWAIDYIGPRKALMIGAATVPAALIMLSQAPAGLPASYAIFLALCAVLGFAGAWISPITVMSIPPRWFNRNLGMALALSGAGFGAGQAFFASLSGRLLASYDWRIAMIVIAGLSSALVWLALILLIRDGSEAVRRSAITEPQPPLRAALSSAPFWLLAIPFMLVACVYSGVAGHLVAMLSDRGIAPEKASLFLAVMGISSVAGRLGAGFLLDRVRFSLVAAPLFIGLAGAVLILWSGTTRFDALTLAAALVGFAIGGEADLLPFVIRRVFHPAQFGRIYGLAGTMFLAGTICGSLFMAYAFDTWGGYGPALIGLFVLALASSAIIALAESVIRAGAGKPPAQ